MFKRYLAASLFALVTALPLASVTHAQPVAASPPPKSIKDLIAQIESVKPRPERIAELKRVVEEPEPASASTTAFIAFHLRRAAAAEELGMASAQLESRRKVFEASRGTANEARHALDLSGVERAYGNYLASETLGQRVIDLKPYVHLPTTVHWNRAFIQARAGLAAESAKAFSDGERLHWEAMSHIPLAGPAHWFRHWWSGLFECARGTWLSDLDRLTDAETPFRKSIDHFIADLPIAPRRSAALGVANVTPAEGANRVRELCTTRLAQNLANQGRIAEAELMLREQADRVLKHYGRESPQTAAVLTRLADLYAKQGRFGDSEWLSREAVRSLESSGADDSGNFLADSRSVYAATLFVRGAYADAVRQGARIADSASGALSIGPAYVIALTRLNRGAEAVSAGDALLKRREGALGAGHVQTAEARGAYAAALRASGRKQEALEAFRTAVQVMVDARGRTQDSLGSSFSKVLQAAIIEEYIGLLVELQEAEGAGRIDPAFLIAEGFAAADLARTGTVQQALAQSAARATADPAFVEAVRKEQDLGRELTRLYQFLSQQLSAPADQQLPKLVADMRARIQTVAAEQAALAADIAKRFPSYANLIAPRPASIEQARAALRDGEALISIYSGERAQFVWVLPKTGDPVMRAVAMDRASLDAEVERVRRTVDPYVRGLTEVPNFAADAAYGLYEKLLKPVEAAFAGARHLIVVANGSLASLPMAMLPTAAPKPEGPEAVWFAGNRETAFLLRKHAITQVPTVNALTTLRALPARSDRQVSFFGVGDPWFSREQAAQAGQSGPGPAPAAVLAARGGQVALRTPGRLDQVNSARLAQLARLPDTAEEIREIATLLGPAANPEVLLGAQANESEVKRRDLRNKRIVMFATHGLMPGELDGLNQPALALSAPEVAGVEGDGLLTAEEILGLRLDADWVVLSACNTAGGAAEGAEALSGLGRAFFYAGTRSLLVSNWPVETVSARLITTGVFSAQKADPTLSRAEALRRTLLALIDKGEAKLPDGRPAYAYAHPLFWAPFMLVGDGN
ncbi:MAG: CHAT domain-containing protein [Burkholderiales bacterium]|nr:CHAT domain-containing protein [Burkholderiales bacterium]